MKKAICIFLNASMVILVALTGIIQQASARPVSVAIPGYDVKVTYTPKNFKWGEPVTFTWRITNVYGKDFENATATLYYRNAEVVTLKPVGFYAKRAGVTLTSFGIKNKEVVEITATIIPTLKKDVQFCPFDIGLSVFAYDSVYVASFDLVRRAKVAGRGGYVDFVILDKATGLLGRPSELQAKVAGGDISGIEYRYDPVDAVFYQNPVVEYGPINKRLIAMMKKIEPALSDSEALLLHSDFFSADGLLKLPVGVELNKVEKGATVGEECEGVFRYMLNEGWLKATRTGERQEWLKREKEKIKKQWNKKGGAYIYPFPDSNIDDYSNLDPKGVAITFSGNWHFKDHQYNKDQGLLASAVAKHVSSAKARVFLTYWYEGTLYRRVTTAKAWTNSDGSFTVIDNLVPSGSTLLKAGPVIYPSGPLTTEQIKITDPNIAEPTWWKDKDDSTLFVMRELGNLGASIIHDVAANVSGDINYSFGDVWTDTFPQARQPNSGAINIYQTVLHALSFTSPPCPDTMRVYWEPGYDSSTFYLFNSNRMFVTGDTITDTDEWDDDNIYHEIGHFLTDYYEGIDPLQAAMLKKGNHQWNVAYPDSPATAWSEGWANYFSCRARVGSGTDSLYVNTSGKIGSSPDINYCYYFNIENPWDFSSNMGSTFDASEYCEGSVAGILWDIYDANDENPYYNDSTRSDVITRGFDEIWNLFDNYDPAYIAATHIWNIRDFRAGWTQYCYGDESAVTSIYAHHGVLDYLPPTSLNATQPIGTLYAQLTWQAPATKTSKSYVGYNIYRKGTTDTIYTLINAETITDTFFADYSVVMEGFYSYYVVTTDSFGYESSPSNIASIYINPLQHSNSSLATAYNNASKLVCDTTGQNLHLVYQSNDKVWYSHSTDGGASWSADTAIGEGQYPAIALDKGEMPNVVWSKRLITREAEMYYRRKTSTGWQGIALLDTFSLGRVPDLVTSITPALAIGKSDTAYLTWLAAPTEYIMPMYDFLFAGQLDINNPSGSFAYSPIDSLSIAAYRCPSLGVDTMGVVHIAWDDNPPGIAYRKRNIDGTYSPKEFISTGPEDLSPCLNFSRWQNNIDVIWEGPILPQIGYSTKPDTGTTWDSIKVLDTLAVQPVVTAGGYAAYSKDNDIYIKRKVGNLWPDSTEKNISNTTGTSNYPQLAFSQTAESTNLYCAWTEGDSAPYQIKFIKIAVLPVAKIYADVGGVDLSPYCIQRAGYKIFGSEPYQTVDYHPQRLIYKFGGFNKNKKYSIEIVYYYQDQSEVAEKEAKGGNRKYWMQELNIDGTCKANTKLVSGQRVVVKKSIPPAAYTKDGEILVYIDKVSGDYAVCAEIFLYEFDKDCEDCTDEKSIQASSSVPNGLPLTTAVYQNAPNPFNQATTIRYQMSKPGNVSLKVYNIAGQLVKTLIDGNKQPGYYSVNWDGKDEKGCKISNGIYLYQLQTTNCSKTYKMVVLR